MAVKVSQVDRETNAVRRLVTYTLRNGNVEADWNEDVPERMRGFIERDGALTANGLFTLQDGKKFLDALPVALSQSSNLIVEKV